ncbi:Arylsulfatase [Crateriforma conspicua]|nr:Arylsulfatase [Crateriforma conspicua]
MLHIRATINRGFRYSGMIRIDWLHAPSLLTAKECPAMAVIARSFFAVFVVSLFVVSQDDQCLAEAQDRPPNIVFIMADDLGYGELGCYGQQKIETPNLDALAKQGVRLTQHYCGAPVCAPSRCVLMTGRHLAKAEVRNNRDSGNGRIFPGQFPLTDEAVTIAEVLKTKGYINGAFGKWGLGPSRTSGSPIRQGFDRFYGYNGQRNAHSFYPAFLDSNEREVRINQYPIPGHDRKPEGSVDADDYRAENYAPDLILKEAIGFIKANKDKTFFAYLPFTEPHVAMQPPQSWIDHYPSQWDQPGEPFDGHGAYRGQNGYLPHPRPRAAYAAMISDLDEHVGQVLQTLDEFGLTDHTIVVFTSDNGSTHEGRDPNFHIGGAACKFFDSTGGLKGYKGSADEGGIRVPCLVRYPGVIPAGTVCDFPSYFPDWFATLSSLAGADGYQDQSIADLSDGTVLTDALRGKDAERQSPMIWEFTGYGGYVVVRDGKWKAIRRDVVRKNPEPWELYDLSSDPGETNDLATEFPERVQAMEQVFLDNRTIEPDFPNPLYDAQTAAKETSGAKGSN